MSVNNKIIKCAKCQHNAETKPNWSEFTITYPIRNKDGQIYCWDCYKNYFSHCLGCGKSAAKVIFPRSGNPYYPHIGGYSSQCERVMNKVNFLCSKKCAEGIATKKYQEWKQKLIQGWTKCEECWRFWSEEYKGGENFEEWLKEEKNQRGFIELVQPGQGKLCSDHKRWEEGGKQRYEEENAEYQKRWAAFSNEEKLAEVKKEYRHGENITEIATRSEIPPMVLYKWREKDSHHRHNCPDCQLDREPTDNNFSSSTCENNSESSALVSSSNDNKIEKLEKELIEAKQQRKSTQEIERIQSELQRLNNQSKEGTKPDKNNNGLILGIVIISSTLFLGVILISKNNKKKKNN